MDEAIWWECAFGVGAHLVSVRIWCRITLVRMILSALPVEIVHAIYVYLETYDVKNLRKTSRFFGEVGAEHLVRETNLVITEWSIARVEALSLHPLVSKGVKAINL